MIQLSATGSNFETESAPASFCTHSTLDQVQMRRAFPACRSGHMSMCACSTSPLLPSKYSSAMVAIMPLRSAAGLVRDVDSMCACEIN